MNRRLLGFVLAALGLILAIVSGLADPLGLSTSDGGEEEFGWAQIAGLAVGVALLILGLILALTAGRRETAATAPPAGDRDDVGASPRPGGEPPGRQTE